MDFEDENMPSLEGSLLLAAPTLSDPNFARTVLFLAAHNQEEGALGYILNRPLGKTVKELIDDEEVAPLGDVPIFIGGPVSMGKLCFASLHWQPKKKQFKFRTHLSTSQAIAHLDKGYSVRAFIGYAGWSEGQLENELDLNTWIQVAPSKTALLPKESLWSTILQELGPYYQLVAMMPKNPSLN